MRTLIVVADSLRPYGPPESIIEGCIKHTLLAPFDPMRWRKRSADRDDPVMPIEGAVICSPSRARLLLASWAHENIETHTNFPPRGDQMVGLFELAQQTGYRYMLITREAVYTHGFSVGATALASEDLLTMVDGVLGPGSVRIGGRDSDD